MFFAGRKIDLHGFLNNLEYRSCWEHPLTVATIDADPDVFDENEQELRENNIAVVYADASNPCGWVKDMPGTPDGFQKFKDYFEDELGFNVEHLDDGEAIANHDAVLTAARAIRLADVSIPRPEVPRSEDVLNQMLNLNETSSILGAGGTLSFSSRGENDAESANPVGKPIPVLEFPSSGDCPAVSGTPYVTE
ncbi:MAG: hypothetical protein ACRDUV_16240 [Pseudonocardiaceae bacterium]